MPNRQREKQNKVKGLRLNLFSLDQKYMDNTSFVSLYAKEIFDYQRENQNNQILPLDWFNKSNADANIRAKSVEFFIQWSVIYNFSQETLFLAIYLFDFLCYKGLVNK